LPPLQKDEEIEDLPLKGPTIEKEPAAPLKLTQDRELIGNFGPLVLVEKLTRCNCPAPAAATYL